MSTSVCALPACHVTSPTCPPKNRSPVMTMLSPPRPCTPRALLLECFLLPAQPLCSLGEAAPMFTSCREPALGGRSAVKPALTTHPQEPRSSEVRPIWQRTGSLSASGH